MDRVRVTPQRVLVVNPFGIGDVLFTTPLLRALREAFPESYIAYLCNRRTQRILLGNPYVNEVLVYEKDELVRLWKGSATRYFRRVTQLLTRARRCRFDYVIDLSLGERYSFVVQMLGIPRRVGFDYRRRGRFLTDRMPISGYQGRHVIDYGRDLLAFIGVKVPDVRLTVTVAAEDAAWADAWLRRRGLDASGGALVGIVPAGGVSWGPEAPYRRWSEEGFAAVGDALMARHGARVLLLGEATDKPMCGRVIGMMRSAPVDASGHTSLGQFIALLKRLDLVVCNDGGPLHLAVSQGVPTVSVFGPVDPNVYGPHPDGGIPFRVVAREELPCRPCYHQFRLPPCPYDRACLTSLEPSAVIEACGELLAAPQPVHG